MKNCIGMVLGVMMAVSVYAVDFTYQPNDDGEGTVTLISAESASRVREIDIPESYAGFRVTRIGDGFMEENSSLTKVVIPGSVRIIGAKAFSDCVNLTAIELNEGLVAVDEGAFGGTALKELVLPASLEYVAKKAFRESPIRSISVGNTAANALVFVYDGVLYCRASQWDGDVVAIVSCVGKSEIQMFEGCTVIGANAFDHGDWESGLRSIVFPKSLKKIGHDAFAHNAELVSADFSGTGLKEISGQDAFNKCTALTTVIFPATVKEICGHCFQNCTALEKVVFNGNAPEIVRNESDEDEQMLDQIYIWKQKTAFGYLEKVVTYVYSGTTGWDTESGIWQGRPLRVIDEDPFAAPFGPFVPGEAVSLAFPELVGYTAKGLPYGLKLNKKTGVITGTPRKPTVATGAAVTFTKRGDATISAKFIVGPIPVLGVTLEGDVEKCKVTGGNKSYLVGKRASLSAKAPKGTAFLGWFLDGQPWPNAEEYLNLRQKYVMTRDDLMLTAVFEKEKMDIDASRLEAAALAAGTEVAAGTIVIDVATQSGLKSLSASRLPRGMKLAKNRKTGIWSVSGKPRSAGEYLVTFKATAKSGAIEQKQVKVVVAE